uniref:Ig-like domain-containing protein n=1 Tax=Sinocyclocheilus anshuiensis TaxID=1608454 RepID=A0A671PKM2_9TELE
QVFRGETVTLKCDIKCGEDTEWTYRWEIEGTNYQYTNSVGRTSTQELNIRSVDHFHSGKYTCTGQMGTQISQHSDAVTLTVSGEFVLRVSPQPWLNEGDSVTLICEVTGSSTGWTFSWFRDDDHLSDSSRGAGGSYTLSPAALQHTGVYTCRAERGRPAYYSKNSNTQPLWITRESVGQNHLKPMQTSKNFPPIICNLNQNKSTIKYNYNQPITQSTVTHSHCGSLVSLCNSTYACILLILNFGAKSSSFYLNTDFIIQTYVLSILSVSFLFSGVSASVSLVVSPSRSQHFSSDSLSLSCEDQSNSTGWSVRRYTDRNTEDCSKLTGSTCRIDSLNTSDTGVYWCQSESGEKRHPLNITVHNGDVILLSSVDPVIEGDTLTLHCLHRSTNSPILRADFYKDGSLFQNQTTGEMNITTVSKSHKGFYYCKTERGQSLHSWISVRGLEMMSDFIYVCNFIIHRH